MTTQRAHSHLLLASADNDQLTNALRERIQADGLHVTSIALGASDADDDAHRSRFRETVAAGEAPTVIGGFSVGARIAATLCPEINPTALLCFGYPFHAANDPDTGHGMEALQRVTVPTRIIQGTRDPHGTDAEVATYDLPPNVELCWLPDGNHRFIPRRRSGFTHEEHIVAAADFAVSFLRTL